MKDLRTLDHLRVPNDKLPPSLRDTEFVPAFEGLFELPSVIDRKTLFVMACSGHHWDHVSVSRKDGIPVWIEMQQVKLTFFDAEEWVIQYHPAESEYVTGGWPGGRSLHVLHMWRPHAEHIPKPPRWMVGANSAREWQQANKDADAAMDVDVGDAIRSDMQVREP